MKFSTLAVVASLCSNMSEVSAFAPPASTKYARPTHLSMAVDMPPAEETSVVASSSDMPVIQSRGGAPVDVRYSDFLKLVNGDRIEKVTFSADGTQLLGVDTDGTRLKLEALPNDPDLLTQLTGHKVDVTVLPSNEAAGGLGDLAQSLILPAALFAGLFFLSRRAGGGMGGGMGPGNPMGMGKSKAEIQMIPDTGVTFEDVAGCDGAKLELVEVVDFLKQPEVYSKNGCRIPRGVILDGPPGTGKTLLAKAVAGEAGVPFISISGSEFVEMFVGVGASRVRDIFGQAKKNAPCIIFIDEIDAVATKRYDTTSGGEKEIQRTMLELLNQLDGFDDRGEVKVIMATNRIDSLDPALIRPGRIDRKIEFPLPDEKTKRRIFGIHTSRMTLSDDMNLEEFVVAKDDLSGADIKAICTEAGMLALRERRMKVTQADMRKAKEKALYKKKGNIPEGMYI